MKNIILMKTTQEFTKEVFNKYPEILVLGNYTGAAKPILLGCKFGHTWKVSPTNLLSKGTRSTCRECVGKNNVRLDWTKNLIDQLKELVRQDIPTEEICKILGTTKISIDNICSKEGINRDRFLSRTKPQIIRLAETLGYTVTKFGKTVYENIEYICNKGHFHSQNAGNFLAGHSCPKCSSSVGTSKVELDFLDFILSKYTGWVETKDRTILEGKELDIVLPDLGIAFEFNGNYWHREERIGKYYHRDKTNMVNNFQYQLIHINESEWANKQDIVKSRVGSILGISSKLYARKCEIKEIKFPKEFLNTNHIQGAGAPSAYNYGLYYKDELVAVMTFSTPKFTKGCTYELVRYCSILNTTIVGGASKLLKYFRNKHFGSIISYSDRRWSKGDLYKKLGFEYSHTSEPNYRYYKRLNSLSRYECQKHLLKDKFPDSYSENLTEKEIMSLEGYYPVYDSGNDVWILN